jgi:POT family proton-dependent oligopeptide transporter
MTAQTGRTVAPAAPRANDVLGHPRGLVFLFTTEMWERFSFYGMKALLVLYMVKYLFHPGVVDRVAGFGTLTHGLEAVFGRLDIQPLASQIYGLYSGLVYLTPILGGLLADRVLGQRRTVVVGAALMAAGHFLMAVEALFLPALLLLILGSGAFKPNISTQVGGLYAPDDPRRDRAYSIFYVGINLGAFLAPLVCGTLGETLGWHYGFAAAGVGMVTGLVIYLVALRSLPPDRLRRVPATERAQPLTRDDRRAVAALLVLFVPVTLFWATYEQIGNTIILWADAYTDRGVDLGPWHATIPTTWFLAFNPFMIFAFTPLVVSLWRWQAGRGREPATVTKMALGCGGVALAFLVLAGGAWMSAGGQASWLWLLAFFVSITLGELYLSPTSLSLVAKLAPGKLLSMMMGVWLATSFTGGILAGWLGSLWSGMEKPQFFLIMSAIAGLAGVVIGACRGPLARRLAA